MNVIPVLEQALPKTPIIQMNSHYAQNTIYVKRDDLLPFAFGGNKVRKAAEFYREIKKEQPDVIMTYGAEGSNHCRVIALMACMMGLQCHIISSASEIQKEESSNRRMVLATGASIETVPVEQVAETIDMRTNALRLEGKRVFFIQGGGHGKSGTEGYVKAYHEILSWEQETGIVFDKIFHASGTGATQAGLVCGELLTRSGEPARDSKDGNETRVTGISIARSNPRGSRIVTESVRDYLGREADRYEIDTAVEFTDAYTLGGYGYTNTELTKLVAGLLRDESLPLDHTYTGKAFYGMLRYLEEHNIRGQNILFIHTGGTPLFYDDLDRIKSEALGQSEGAYT